jgi:hypothetical protein
MMIGTVLSTLANAATFLNEAEVLRRIVGNKLHVQPNGGSVDLCIECQVQLHTLALIGNSVWLRGLEDESSERLRAGRIAFVCVINRFV